MLAAVDRITRYEADPANRLFHRVDLTAHRRRRPLAGRRRRGEHRHLADSPITTVVTFDLPNKVFTFPPRLEGVLARGDHGARPLPQRGERPAHLGDAHQPGVPRRCGGSAAGMALLARADHNTIQHAAPGYPAT